ncbi:zinc ribbon domain-containing protein [Paenibacillus sp. FSL H8-0317]|uniref:zinc ribbon domain-containing protein n=1 Tax=Paenibacillus sp. FSL H8-0317 TaxID=2921385 RepID=UPI00324E020F
MYCKHCGTKTVDGALYCQMDGSALLPLSEVFQLKKDATILFCSHCSCENSKENIYCISCGASLDKVTEKANPNPSSANVESAYKKDSRPALYTNQKSTGKSTIWTSSIYSVIPLFVSILLSWSISAGLNHKIKDLISSETRFEFADFSTSVVEKIKLIATTDVLMLSHLVSLKLDADTSYFGANIETSGGLLLLAAIPIITLFITGYWLGRKTQTKSAIERITSSFPIAVIYSICFACISLFSGLSMDESGVWGSISLKTTYSFGNALLHSFIISLIFISVGSLLSLPRSLKGSGSNQKYGISIKRALMTTISGMMICIVIVCGYLYSEKEFAEDNNMSSFTKIVIATQIGGYSWHLSNLNNLNGNLGIKEYDTTEYGQLSYSLFTGIKATSLFGYSPPSGAVSVGGQGIIGDKNNIDYTWILLFVTVALVLHAWSGIQLRRAGSGRTLKELIAYGVAFGVVMVIMAYIIKVSVDTETFEITRVSLQFPIIQSFIISTLVAFVGASIGWILSSKLTRIN